MKLGDLELEVMQLFWAESPRSTPEIYDIISKKKEVAYTTIRTVVDRLEAKEALCRVRNEGRTIFYSPLIKKSSVMTDIVNSFVERVYQGNSSELVMQLLKNFNAESEDIGFFMDILKQKNDQTAVPKVPKDKNKG